MFEGIKCQNFKMVPASHPIYEESGLTYEPWLGQMEANLKYEFDHHRTLKAYINGAKPLIYLPFATNRMLNECEKFPFLKPQVERIRALMLKFTISYTD